MIEAVEARVLMSGDIAAPGAEPVPLLLPAVQAAREAARRSASTDGTSNTIMVAETYQGTSTFQITFGGQI